MIKDAPLPVSQLLAAPAPCTTPDPMGTPVGYNLAGLQAAPAARQSPGVTITAYWREMLGNRSNTGTDQI